MQLLSHTGLVAVSVAPSPEIIRASRQPSKNSAAGKSREGGAALSLRVQMREVHAALKDSVLFKRVLSDLPA